jgi:hypothetical protein
MPERFSAENRAMREPKTISIFDKLIARFEGKGRAETTANADQWEPMLHAEFVGINAGKIFSKIFFIL